MRVTSEHDAGRLAAAVPAERIAGGDRRVGGVCDDTRTLAAGDLFVVRGEWSDACAGRLAAAAAGGAGAAVLPADAPDGLDAAGLTLFRAAPGTAVDQAAAGRVADAFFGRPADGLALLGVTGTNGKTTVATLAQRLLASLGVPTGLLGTVAVDTGAGPRPATLTTPGAIELRRRFAEMRDAGLRAVAMEASSHALDQGRTAGLAFDAAVFTNLTQDHLDYHRTMEAYADAKARLFGQLGPGGVAVVNAEDPAAGRFGCGAGRRVGTRIGSGEPADGGAAAEVRGITATCASATFRGPFGVFEATLATGGRHNVSNALQAVVAAHALAERIAPGVATPAALAAALSAAPPVPGRLQPVRGPAGSDAPDVLVDYAHTPDALARVLAAVREGTPGRVVCVYGCGGDRDRTKRPWMTEAALAGADRCVLTSDNPRTEDPQRILADASAGVSPADRSRLSVVADRREAIRAAIASAGPGDAVLIAGKGHEDYQLVAAPEGGVERHPFDDAEEAASALAARTPRA